MAEIHIEVPDDLLERVRSRTYEHDDRVAIAASNFAYFLAPELRKRVIGNLNNLRNSGQETDQSSRQHLVTSILAGFAAAAEEFVVSMESYVEEPEKLLRDVGMLTPSDDLYQTA